MKLKNVKKSIITGIIIVFILPLSLVFAEESRQVPEDTAGQESHIRFNSADYQSSIQSDNSLSDIAKEQSQLGEQAAAFGFSAKSDDAKFFLIGTLYSEALAHLKNSKFQLAADRLDAIEQQFVALQVPGILYNFIARIHSRVALEQYSPEALLDMLSFFQPLFEDHAKKLSPDRLILFQAGSWLTDMSLTAAANDNELIRQARPQLDYFIKELKRMDAPKGVMKACQDIKDIAAKEKISDKDAQKVLQRVKKIQTILG